MSLQVFVTSSLPAFIPNVGPGLKGGELGSYNGNLAYDKKVDITYEPGFGLYLRGKWVTIVGTTTSKLTLSEIRVYGSK